MADEQTHEIDLYPAFLCTTLCLGIDRFSFLHVGGSLWPEVTPQPHGRRKSFADADPIEDRASIAIQFADHYSNTCPLTYIDVAANRNAYANPN